MNNHQPTYSRMGNPRSVWLVAIVLHLCHRCPVSDGFLVGVNTGAARLPLVRLDATPAPPNKKRSKRAPRPPRFTQRVHDVSSKNKRPKSSGGIETDRVWKSRRKSIEELEEIMTQRWGTDLSAWTAQDVEDDDDDTDHQSVSKKEVKSTFRAKPVRDPWNPNSGKRQRDDDDEEDGPATSSFLSKGSGQDDKVLRRVRQNQKREQERKNKSPPRRQPVTEFYDEDDEGYESKAGGPLSHLISPKPVGGRGSTETWDENINEEWDVPGDDLVPEKAAGGFFFRNPAGAQQGETQKSASKEPAPTKKNRKPARSVPILDDDGNPMYLTTAQAERNFQSGLKDNDLEEELLDVEQRMTTYSTWEDLGVHSTVLLENLEAMGCPTPLAVQEKSCPEIMSGKDVLVGMYTGSGKTLAFLVPLAQRLLDEAPTGDGALRLLIVAPGRELASQIVSVARDLLQGTGLSAMLAIGGTTFARNLEQLRKRKPEIVVGTPGRLAELVVGRPGERSGRLKTAALEALVLDEFDALLEYKPHRDPTNAVLETLKRKYGEKIQSVMCSATASDMVKSPQIKRFLRPGYVSSMADENDALVTSSEAKKNAPRVSKTVIHGVVHVPHRRLVLETVRRILHTEPIPQQILIFADDARRVDLLVDKLGDMGIIAAPLHGGNRSDKLDRAEVSKALREGYVGLVIATELAARGLDAPLLTHVINVDLPTDASHYAHRAGRCGRGGRPGVVINITSNPKERNVPQKFAEQLGIDLHTVEVRSGKLGIVDPSSAMTD